jgi:DNA-binding transcriptional LysR family regulator
MSQLNFAALDLNLLRVFDAMLDERSVTRAGDRLNLTQSAVSHALRRLREVIGDDLFVRRSSGMEPTPRALEIGPALHAGLLQLQAALAPMAFDPATTERRFVLAAGSYACAVLIPPLVERMRRHAPSANLQIVTSGLGAIDGLDAGRVDAAIAGLEMSASRFGFRELVRESMVWVVRSDHALARAPLTMEGLVEATHILVSGYEDEPDEGMVSGISAAFGRRSLLDQPRSLSIDLASRGVARRVGVVAPDAFSALAIVSRSDMVAAVPRRLAEGAVAAGRVLMLEPPYPTPSIEIGAVFRTDRLADPAVAWLVQMLEDIAALL